jgi:hypothetical protein
MTKEDSSFETLLFWGNLKTSNNMWVQSKIKKNTWCNITTEDIKRNTDGSNVTYWVLLQYSLHVSAKSLIFIPMCISQIPIWLWRIWKAWVGCDWCRITISVCVCATTTANNWQERKKLTKVYPENWKNEIKDEIINSLRLVVLRRVTAMEKNV